MHPSSHLHLFISFSLFLAATATTWAGSDTMELRSPAPKSNGHFGVGISSVPDIDGDGRRDLVVGAWQENPGSSPRGAGRAYLYSSSGELRSILVSPHEETGGSFGTVVSGVPDTDDDGFGDVIIGAPREDPGDSAIDSGVAYVFSGANGALRLTLRSPNPEIGGNFGIAVAGIADLNGDGSGDLVVGAYREDPDDSPIDAGRAYIFSGRDGSLLAILRSPSEQTRGRFGLSISRLSDLDGDGRADILVGAPHEHSEDGPAEAGRAHVFSGRTGSLIQTLSSPVPQARGLFGFAVSDLADVNGDGADDYLIGAQRESSLEGHLSAGRVHVYSGSTHQVLATLQSPSPQAGGMFGVSVRGVPDMDGDGAGEILVGAVGEGASAGLPGSGRVHIWSGASRELLTSLTSPNQESSGNFGGANSLDSISPTAPGTILPLTVSAFRENPGSSPMDSGVIYVFSMDCNANGLIDAGDIAEGRSTDCDDDGIPDECEPDGDSDGVPDPCDACPTDPAYSFCECGVRETDLDFDGLPDCVDNCVEVFNPAQTDRDGDGIGDACDPCQDKDDDGFGDPNEPGNFCPTDNCPEFANPTQTDCDGNGIGDICDVVHGSKPDCNQNMIPDACDIAGGGSTDLNFNGVPDECDGCTVRRHGDVDDNGFVDVDDIVCVLNAAQKNALCPAGDIFPCGGDGILDVDDIAAILDAYASRPRCPDTCELPGG